MGEYGLGRATDYNKALLIRIAIIKSKVCIKLGS